MCGICGIYYFDRNKEVSHSVLKKMNDKLKHRGPDGEGYFIDRNIGFGHRRLKIIDLSDNANQPMFNEDNKICLIYNGEIYNYIELRKELKKAGHIFKTESDTEIIIHAYEEWGHKCLNRFNGMWAFALWDNKKKELFCARDRFGIKPFYFYTDNEKFIFASEIKSILSSRLVENKLNERQSFLYLTMGLDYTNYKETFYENIFQLQASEFLIIKDAQKKIVKYYDIPEKQIDENNLENDIRDIFYDSISLRLRSDVEIGLCLSGGIDSTSILANMFKLSDNNKFQPKTFTFDDYDKNNSELNFVRDILKKYPCDNNLIKIKYDDHLEDTICRCYIAQEQPIEGPSKIANWLMMKKINQLKLKVILNGQGGDELFGGYERHLLFQTLDKLLNIELKPFYNNCKDISNKCNISVIASIAKVLKLLIADFAVKKIWKKKKYLKYINKNYYAKNIDLLIPKKITKKYGSYLNWFLYDEIYNGSLINLLKSEDKNTMYFGIEERLPFLDYRLVELAINIDSKYKISDGLSKYIFRKSMKNLLPVSIYNNRVKYGFRTSKNRVYNLLKHKIMTNKDLFFDDSINKIFCIDKITNIFKNENIIDFKLVDFIYWNYSRKQL